MPIQLPARMQRQSAVARSMLMVPQERSQPQATAASFHWSCSLAMSPHCRSKGRPKGLSCFAFETDPVVRKQSKSTVWSFNSIIREEAIAVMVLYSALQCQILDMPMYGI